MLVLVDGRRLAFLLVGRGSRGAVGWTPLHRGSGLGGCSMWLFSWPNDSSHSGVYLKSFADFSAQKKVELLSPAREIKRLYDH
ncbi:hypothetical protein BHE74_00046312 [Ensete ventricosum]|nr:hypothetical protein BHE74_00046312 [Ensete ventricosum]